MATANSAVLPLGLQDHIIVIGNNDNNSLDTCITNTSNSVESEEIQRCFVCDVQVQGRYYALAACKTQNSKTRIIEKLGELVGERYMVVISENDIICRSCASLLNTLDRLELEMQNIRDSVLRFLEKKYALEEGELLGSAEKPKLCQPPQITACTGQCNSNGIKKTSSSTYAHEKNRTKKSNLWMQCDKCRYTARLHSFVPRHTQDHFKIKQKTFYDKPSNFTDGQCTRGHNYFSKKAESNNKAAEGKEKELPTTNVNNSMDVPLLEKTVHQNMPLMPVQVYSQVCNRESDSMSLIRLSNPENLHMQNILSPDRTNVTSEPMYIKVLQQADVNEDLMNSTIINKPDCDMEESMIHKSSSDTEEMVMKVKSSAGKQMLTLSEDGNLEMVEVAWSDMHSSDVSMTLQ